MRRWVSDFSNLILQPPVERALEALELSEQERQIVRLVLFGRSSSEMMKVLHIRLGNPRTNKRHILVKLEVHKQSQLVAVVFAKASEFEETTSRGEIVVRSFDARQWLRHPAGEYVAEKHLAARYRERKHVWPSTLMKPSSASSIRG